MVSTAPNNFERYGVPVALLAAVLVSLLLPGDAPFINDEPKLISSALSSNEHHRLADESLLGTRGITYGPFPLWIYQLLLRVTHDLRWIVILRVLLFGLAAGCALWSLGRTLELWAWFAPVALVSPYFWYYARHLWDNSFAIPLSAVAVAAYAAFLTRPSNLSLGITIAAVWALLFTHLMTLALVIPLALHLLVFARGSLRRGKWTVLGVSAVALFAGFPYCRYLVSGGIQSSQATINAAGWIFPLLGPRVLSAQGFRYFFTPDWQLGGQGMAAVLGAGATIVSSISFPLVWVGIGLTLRSILLRFRERKPITSRESVYGLAFAVLCAQILLNGITGTSRHPHYYNGTWIIFILFAWLTVDFFARRRLGSWITVPYAAAQLAAIGLVLSQIHTHGGSRAGFGPTIANQMNVAAEVKRYSPQSPLQIGVLNYKLFPHAILALLRLAPEPSGPRPRANLAIVYASNDPLDGRIKLVAQ